MTARIVCHRPDLPPAEPVRGLTRLTSDDWAVGLARVDPAALTTPGYEVAIDRWWSGGKHSFLALSLIHI